MVPSLQLLQQRLTELMVKSSVVEGQSKLSMTLGRNVNWGFLRKTISLGSIGQLVEVEHLHAVIKSFRSDVRTSFVHLHITPTASIRQDKTRQDKTRQDKTRQDYTMMQVE